MDDSFPQPIYQVRVPGAFSVPVTFCGHCLDVARRARWTPLFCTGIAIVLLKFRIQHEPVGYKRKNFMHVVSMGLCIADRVVGVL